MTRMNIKYPALKIVGYMAVSYNTLCDELGMTHLLGNLPSLWIGCKSWRNSINNTPESRGVWEILSKDLNPRMGIQLQPEETPYELKNGR